MRQIIRYSHIEELTQEVADTFIKKVYAYKDKRVEIEWNFSMNCGIGGKSNLALTSRQFLMNLATIHHYPNEVVRIRVLLN